MCLSWVQGTWGICVRAEVWHFTVIIIKIEFSRRWSQNRYRLWSGRKGWRSFIDSKQVQFSRPCLVQYIFLSLPSLMDPQLHRHRLGALSSQNCSFAFPSHLPNVVSSTVPPRYLDGCDDGTLPETAAIGDMLWSTSSGGLLPVRLLIRWCNWRTPWTLTTPLHLDRRRKNFWR